MYNGVVYSLECLVDDTFPHIDFSIQNHETDWLAVAEMLDGERIIDPELIERSTISLNSKNADVIYFELRLMLSERAKCLFESLKLDALRFYKTSISGIPFYHLVNSNVVDCFDRKKSKFKTFSGSKRIMEVSQYVFVRDKIVDPSIFTIPERRGRLFCTQAIVDAILHENLVGVRHFDIEHPPADELIA